MEAGESRNAYKPDYAVHPGEYLEEVLEARNIKKREFAQRVGLSVKAVSQIINAKSLYSSEVALRFERVLGISALIWSNMAENYQLFEAREEEQQKLQSEEVKEWVRRFPTADLKRLKILPDTRKIEELAEGLLRFFGVSSIDAWKNYSIGKAASYRQSGKFEISREAVEVWLKLADQQAETIETREFSRKILTDALTEIRGLTILPPEEFFPRMIDLCAAAGVALVLVPELKGTRISGAARWLTSSKAMIALSLRYRTNDQFWFSFFHEAAHILLHGKKVFLDQKEDPGRSEKSEEAEADDFSCNLLIPKPEYRRFTAGGSFFERDILIFADKIGIHPGIVAGRLQHDGLLDYKYQNNLKEKFEYVYSPDEESE